MKRIILCLSLFAFFGSQAQQINPVPDYVFSNKMSVGRNAVTDTAAYFSIGPRYGAIRGMMPPMVTDTASMSATKRNGLLIFSIQKNKYLYWDSVGSKWAEMAGTAGSAITGSGVAGYMPEFTTATNIDTTRLYHSNGRFAIGSTTTTNGVFNVYGGQSYFDTSLKVGSQTLLADEGKNEVYVNTTSDAGAYALQVAGSIYNTTGAVLAASSGSVGIGTASPAYRLDVTGQVRNTTNAYFSTTDGSVGIGTTSAQGKLDVYEPGILNYQIVLRNGGTYHTGIIGSSAANALSDANAWGIFGGPNSYVTGISNSTAIVLGTSVASFQITRNANLNDGPAATNFYLRNSDGQIGIGNTNPSYRLDITGTLRSTGNTFLGTSSSEVYVNTTTDAGAYALQVAGSIYNTTGAVFAASSGSVGIGTTNPAAILHTITPSNSNLGFILDGTGATGTRLEIRKSNTTNTYFGDGENIFGSGYAASTALSTGGANFMAFGTNLSERMRIKSDGEVLIGTTSDAGTYALQVTGAIYNTTTITTGAPSGGTAKPFKIGAAATVSPTSPNRTIEIEIDGTTYYLHAKTTND